MRNRAGVCVAHLTRLWPDTLQRLRERIHPRIVQHHDTMRKERANMQEQFEMLAVRSKIRDELTRQLHAKHRMRQLQPSTVGFQSRVAQRQSLQQRRTMSVSPPPPTQRRTSRNSRPNSATSSTTRSQSVLPRPRSAIANSRDANSSNAMSKSRVVKSSRVAL